MPTFKQEYDHLSYLGRSYRKCAQRCDQTRATAVGLVDFGSGIAHDPALSEQIDWFDRRWVQQVELGREHMLMAAEGLERARESYKLTEDKVKRSLEPHQSQRRNGADL